MLDFAFSVFYDKFFRLTGGGKLEIEVAHTLTVDGYVMSNSDDVVSVSSWHGASGGSGGSIIINTVNFTGKWSLCTLHIY